MLPAVLKRVRLQGMGIQWPLNAGVLDPVVFNGNIGSPTVVFHQYCCPSSVGDDIPVNLARGGVSVVLEVDGVLTGIIYGVAGYAN